MGNLANVRVKPVKVMLDKERSILFDLNAFAALEEEYGDVDKALDALSAGKFKALRAVLWAGLIHEDDSLTVKDVGKIVTSLADLKPVAEAINESLKQSMPDADEGKK